MDSLLAKDFTDISSLLKNTEYIKNFTFKDYDIFDDFNNVIITNPYTHFNLHLQFQMGNLYQLNLNVENNNLQIIRTNNQSYIFNINDIKYQFNIDEYGNTTNDIPHLIKVTNHNYKYDFFNYSIVLRNDIRYFLSLNSKTSNDENLEIYIGSNKDLHNKIVIFSNYTIFKLYNDVGDSERNILYGNRVFLYRKNFFIDKNLITLNKGDDINITNNLGYTDQYNIIFNIKQEEYIYSMNYNHQNNTSTLNYLSFNMKIGNIKFSILFDFLDINDNNINIQTFSKNYQLLIYVIKINIAPNFTLRFLYKFLLKFIENIRENLSNDLL
jgi:hypothetical protein